MSEHRKLTSRILPLSSTYRAQLLIPRETEVAEFDLGRSGRALRNAVSLPIRYGGRADAVANPSSILRELYYIIYLRRYL